MKRTRLRGAVAAGVLAIFVWARADAQIGEPACVETPRPGSSDPALEAERLLFGFHDEEIVICSPGFERPTHITARLWVPAECPGVRECPGVLISHGFGFSKELTFADMLNAVERGMVVLSYDVRGHGTSGGQSSLMGRDEIVDQAAVLRWFHDNVAPTKVGVYGISQGGAHALMAGIFNCGEDRAADQIDSSFHSTVACDEGKRWVHAIVPVQAPTRIEGNGTCSMFGVTAVPESRLGPELTRAALRCPTEGTVLEEPVNAATEELRELDPSLRDYLSRADLIDVPTYLATSFFDRLVLPQNVTAMYGILRDRVEDPNDPYSEDLRLIISNDAHGDIGGNFAVLDDLFLWLELQLHDQGNELIRHAPVATAQEWADGTFRLEADWPIPGTTETIYFLSRTEDQPEGNGMLVDEAPSGEEPNDEMRNGHVVSGAPEAPGTSATVPSGSGAILPGTRLTYVTEPFSATTEVSDLPQVSFWVSSTNMDGEGRAQFHVALHEARDDGSTTEFARNLRGVRDLGPMPTEVAFALTVSSHRIDAGNRLMLQITSSDPNESQPFVTLDSVFLHHDAAHPSQIMIPTAPVAREDLDGPVPEGPAFTTDFFGAVCRALRLPCPGSGD